MTCFTFKSSKAQALHPLQKLLRNMWHLILSEIYVGLFFVPVFAINYVQLLVILLLITWTKCFAHIAHPFISMQVQQRAKGQNTLHHATGKKNQKKKKHIRLPLILGQLYL